MLLKYDLDLYKDMPNFPTSQDILFELRKYLKKNKFSFSNMKDCLTFKINRKEWEVLINELIDNNKVEKLDKDSYILLGE